MADKYAIVSGNWSSTATWNGGTLPSTGDTVYANGFNIDINVSAKVVAITNLAGPGGINAGGQFRFSNGVSLTADLITCGVNNTEGARFAIASPAVCYIYGNIIPFSTQVGQLQAFRNSSSGTVYIYGNILDATGIGSDNNNDAAVINASNGQMFITGNVYGHNANKGHGLKNAGTGFISVTGNVFGGLRVGQGNTRISSGIYNASTGAVAVFGNVYGNENGPGITNNSSGSAYVIGQVYGGTFASGTDLRSSGIYNASTGYVFVSGAVFGSLSAGGAAGIENVSTGTVIVSGYAKGGRYSGSHGIINNANYGTVSVIRAIGNGFGITSQSSEIDKAYGPAYGVLNRAVSGRCFVAELECGSRGMFPVAGIIYLLSRDTSVIIFKNNTLKTSTLYRPGFASNYTPVASDVRLGVIYDENKKTGTLPIPGPADVNINVPVDNTIGSGVFDGTKVFDVNPKNIRIKGSIGERVSRVATTSATKYIMINIS